MYRRVRINTFEDQNIVLDHQNKKFILEKVVFHMFISIQKIPLQEMWSVARGFLTGVTYPWEGNVICQGFTPGKVETRNFDILIICQGYNPWERCRREIK
jgi:hypothetical protein